MHLFPFIVVAGLIILSLVMSAAALVTLLALLIRDARKDEIW